MTQNQQQEFTDFEIDVNLEAVEAWGGEGYPLAPAGDFALTLVNLEQKASSKQQPMLVATFEIADEGEHNGKKVWNNYSLQEQSRGRLKSLSVACGARLDKFIASEHVGQTIRASIVHVDGQASIDAQGNPRPPRTFANVINEMPLEDQPVVAPEPIKPPVMKGKAPPVTPQAKPSTNGQPRRT